jgi:hypothetical protein
MVNKGSLYQGTLLEASASEAWIANDNQLADCYKIGGSNLKECA